MNMREIKFRAWDVFKKKMDTFENYLDWCKENDMETTPFHKTRRWILMQYTGLLDKSGFEIYEGDIVKELGFLPEPREEIIKVVEWDSTRAGFLGKRISGTGFGVVIGEVIGNIYENPELLKTGGEHEDNR